MKNCLCYQFLLKIDPPLCPDIIKEISMEQPIQFRRLISKIRTPNPYPLKMDDGTTINVPLRRSKKAWHISIRVSPVEGVHVVIPWSCAARHAVAFLEEKRGWITNQQKKILHKLKNELPKERPENFHLLLTNKSWLILFTDADQPFKLKQQYPDLLTISGCASTSTTWIRCLEKWLVKEAKKLLPNMLETCAKQMSLRVKKVAIRCQKTRWGSCSANGTISLNAKLLFFPEHLVRYILIHELCHLIHHNHGPNFWKMLEKYEPSYRERVKEVRALQTTLPWWVT
jgi:predicted metal-dependent hydrolase